MKVRSSFTQGLVDLGIGFEEWDQNKVGLGSRGFYRGVYMYVYVYVCIYIYIYMLDLYMWFIEAFIM